MYVNTSPDSKGPRTDQSSQHLLTWMATQSNLLPEPIYLYSLNSIIETPILSAMMKNIDEQFIAIDNVQQDFVQYWVQVFEGFLLRECAKKFRGTYRSFVLKARSAHELLKIMLYCCVNSKDKEQYIERIVQLDEEVQATLMKCIQQISSNLLNVLNKNMILERIEQLESELQNVKQSLQTSVQNQQGSQKQIKQLQQQLKCRNTQVKKYKNERQKLIETLQLSNFDQYLTIFQRLQQQNRILNRYVEQLQDNNNEFEKKQKQLRKQLENQSVVIVDLNQSISNLKGTIRGLKSQWRFDDVQANRSFGVQLKNSSNKENMKSPKKDLRKQFEQFDVMSSKSTHRGDQELALLQQMKQVRKYNTDLITKLQTTYKALSNLTNETSHMRQKNENLAKQNKFYRKQIKDLRNLQEKMQVDLVKGLI